MSFFLFLLSPSPTEVKAHHPKKNLNPCSGTADLAPIGQPHNNVHPARCRFETPTTILLDNQYKPRTPCSWSTCDIRHYKTNLSSRSGHPASFRNSMLGISADSRSASCLAQPCSLACQSCASSLSHQMRGQRLSTNVPWFGHF
jgi:hypothetical protein